MAVGIYLETRFPQPHPVDGRRRPYKGNESLGKAAVSAEQTTDIFCLGTGRVMVVETIELRFCGLLDSIEFGIEPGTKIMLSVALGRLGKRGKRLLYVYQPVINFPAQFIDDVLRPASGADFNKCHSPPAEGFHAGNQ
jgi:hypothetical protein